MGFLNSLGEVLGEITAQAQEADSFKAEYEQMNNQELKREYEDLTKRSKEVFCSKEIKYRLMAVKMVINDRRSNS